jgi:hypothetical protein
MVYKRGGGIVLWDKKIAGRVVSNPSIFEDGSFNETLEPGSKVWSFTVSMD